MSYRSPSPFFPLLLTLLPLAGCQSNTPPTRSTFRPSDPAQPLLASYHLPPSSPTPNATTPHVAPFVRLLPNPNSPHRTPSSHVAVLVSLNDGPPHPFILDTGTPVTAVLVSQQLLALPAVSRKLHAARPARIQGLAAGTAPAYHTTADSLAVGPCRVSPFPYLLIPSPRDPAASLGQTPYGPVVGILGNDFLSHFRLTLDYQRQTLTLESR